MLIAEIVSFAAAQVVLVVWFVRSSITHSSWFRRKRNAAHANESDEMFAEIFREQFWSSGMQRTAAQQ